MNLPLFACPLRVKLRSKSIVSAGVLILSVSIRLKKYLRLFVLSRTASAFISSVGLQ